MPDQDPQAHSELATFGEDLKREREIRGISLKEIADATKISKRFLEAIEKNDHKTLPAPVFTRGFVREYARYLGLNIDDMVNRYNHAAAGDDRIEKPPQLAPLTPPAVDPPKKAAAKKGIPSAFTRIDRNIFLLTLIVVALAAVSWWAIQYRRGAQREEAVVETATAETVTTPAAVPTPVPTQTAAPAPDDTTLRLTIDLSDDCWIQLQADGKTLVADVMRAGYRNTFEAKDQFRLSVGNAAAAGVSFNDVRLPTLGGDGEVIKNRVFDREALQRLRAAGPETAQ